MKHVQLQILSEDLQRTSLLLARLGVFGPDGRPLLEDDLPFVPGARYRDLFKQSSSRLEKILELVTIAPQGVTSSIRVVTEEELDELNNWLGEAWARCSTFEENLRRLRDEDHLIDQLHRSLDNFANLDIDLSLLRSGKRFLDLHVGVVPRENVHQLREAIGIAGFLLFIFSAAEGNAHVIVVGPQTGEENRLSTVLSTAGFRELDIPAELQRQPELVREELQQKRLGIARERDILLNEFTAWGKMQANKLGETSHILELAAPFASLGSAARSAGHLSIIQGWVPARKAASLRRSMEAELSNPFLLQTRDPLPSEQADVPSIMRIPRFLESFATLVRTYGTPRYGEIDPTLLFTLTYVVMFGMMFGDVGHGVTIALVAWLARRKLKRFTVFAVFAGLSATTFGFMYGSIFGYEHILQPIWIAPLSDPIYMLLVALGCGVVFLFIAGLISIHNRLANKDLLAAFFDNNGVISLLLYFSLLAGAYKLFEAGSFGWPAALATGFALALLAGYKWTRTKAPRGERLLIALLETFETLTGYASNTLSFLRISAFSLNHVALAIAVFTLADMMSTAGHVLMVIFGNLFILVLEGAIVTIQTLRLEYYEGFSRFFSGDGKKFQPLQLGSGLADHAGAQHPSSRL